MLVLCWFYVVLRVQVIKRRCRMAHVFGCVCGGGLLWAWGELLNDFLCFFVTSGGLLLATGGWVGSGWRMRVGVCVVGVSRVPGASCRMIVVFFYWWCWWLCDLFCDLL